MSTYIADEPTVRLVGDDRLRRYSAEFKQGLEELESATSPEEARPIAERLCETSRDMIFEFVMLQRQLKSPSLAEVAEDIAKAAELIEQVAPADTSLTRRNLRLRAEAFRRIAGGEDPAMVFRDLTQRVSPQNSVR